MREREREREREMMRRGKKQEEDEVEEMLKAAQDEMILKLSLDSHHRSRSGIDYLDPDLHSRFLSLKSQPSATKKDKDQIRRTRSPPQKSKDVVVEEESTEDLMARFSSLKKTSLPSSSSSPSVNLRDRIGEDEEEEDEVEKLIQWAIDAARLDPSPPSDDDDDQSCDDDDGDNDSTKDNKS